MSDQPDRPERPNLAGFEAHAEELAAYIAAADAAGEPVPDEARTMLASLRDLSRAVDQLRQSLDEPPAPPDAPADTR